MGKSLPILLFFVCMSILISSAGALPLEAGTLDEAQALASRQNTLIFVDFYSPN